MVERFGLLIFCFLIAFPAKVQGADAPHPVYQETFEGDASLADRGWSVDAKEDQSTWTVKDGVLEVAGHHKPYTGGQISHKVPKLDRGELSFRIRFTITGTADYDPFSIGQRLYGHMTAFKHLSGHLWMSYQPVNTWTILTTEIPLTGWVPFRIVFDRPARRIEYYWGESEDPAFVNPEFAFGDTETDALIFFNYGLSKGTLVHQIDNVSLRPLPAVDAAQAAEARNRVMLFRGLSADQLRAGEIARQLAAGGPISTYTMETRGAAIAPRNQFALRSVPGMQRWQDTKYIVLADVPAAPQRCLPDYLIKDIARAVEQGAHLLVLAGMFSLSKGGYAGTALGEILPVVVSNRWNARPFSTPMPLSSSVTGRQQLLNENPKPGVLWLQQSVLRGEKTEVLLTAGETPILVRQDVGRGTVSVFLGMPCGDFQGKTVEPFWKWKDWPELIAKLMLVRSP